MEYSELGQTVAFADGYPVLVTHQSTLDQLNQKLSHAIDMSRFRANIVVTTSTKAWSELNWLQLSNNSLLLNLTKPCARCVMTGIDQQTGNQTGSEVLKTLKQQFAYQDKAVFGINAIPSSEHGFATQLKVGMNLQITQKPNTE